MNGNKEHNVLLVPLIIMTISIIALSVVSQYFINQSLKGVKDNVNTIELAHKERMLSQEVVKAIATDNLLGESKETESLDSLMSIFERLHHGILKGDTQLNLQALNIQFHPQYHMLDKAYTSFSEAIELNVGDEYNNNFFVQLLAAQNAYLQQLDKLISEINGYSNSKVHRFQSVQLIAMISSLLIVTLEFIFILLPTFNKINKQNKHLRQIAFNQSHLVRHPLTNLKELLYLISTSKSSEELEELVSLAKTEADELDSIISNTVYNAAQGKPT